MTLSELMRGLGHDGVLYSLHASAQKCVNLRPIAVQFYGQLRAD